jgi:hypothetical protein
MTETNLSDDRILHMSDMCVEAMPAIRAWAVAKGVGAKLDDALDYLRTYSKGPEAEWHSHLHLDIFFNAEKPSFTCNVSRRDPEAPKDRERFKTLMFIGMMWNDNDQDWSFHS